MRVEFIQMTAIVTIIMDLGNSTALRVNIPQAVSAEIIYTTAAFSTITTYVLMSH